MSKTTKHNAPPSSKDHAPEANPADGGTEDSVIDETATEAAARARVELGLLHLKMARKRCAKCGGVGHWKIEHTEGRIRKLRCLACGIGVGKVVVTESEINAAIAA